MALVGAAGVSGMEGAVKVSSTVAYLMKHCLLSQAEKDALFFANKDIPEEVKKLARALRAEMERRKAAK